MLLDINAWLGQWPFRALRDNTPDTLLARLDRCGIDAAAVSPIEAIFHRNVQPANLKFAQTIAPYADRLIPLATLNPTYPAWEEDLDACRQLDMRGVRLFPQYHNYPIDGPLGQDLAHACAESNLPILIPHRLEDPRQHHWMDSGQTVDLARVANLIAAVPAATIIVPNLRNPILTPLWQRSQLRQHNWYVDLSLAELEYTLHLNLDGPRRDLSDFVAAGGADHLLFGTHLPFSYAGPALVKLDLLPVDAQTRTAIAGQRAAQLLNFPPTH